VISSLSFLFQKPLSTLALSFKVIALDVVAATQLTALTFTTIVSESVTAVTIQSTVSDVPASLAMKYTVSFTANPLVSSTSKDAEKEDKVIDWSPLTSVLKSNKE